MTYDVNRCVHVEARVAGLPSVVDPDARPWVRPDEADADDVASTVVDCPTGALQVDRTDGGSEESVPDDGTLFEDTRVMPCRHGASGQQAAL